MKTLTDGMLVACPDGAGEPASLEARIARLEDRAAVEELLYHYARSVDALDACGVGSCFAQQGELRSGGAVIAGRSRIEKLYGKLLHAMRSSTHVLGNVQVLFEGPDSALAHAALHAWDSYADPNTPDCISYGWYECRAVREADGEWRFATLNIYFAGQLDPAGNPASERSCEQFGRPWPPRPDC